MSTVGSFWVEKSMEWEYKKADKFCMMGILNATKSVGKGV